MEICIEAMRRFCLMKIATIVYQPFLERFISFPQRIVSASLLLQGLSLLKTWEIADISIRRIVSIKSSVLSVLMD